MRIDLRPDRGAALPFLKNRFLLGQFVLMAGALASHVWRPGFLAISLFFALAALASLTLLSQAIRSLADPAAPVERTADARRVASLAAPLMAGAIGVGLFADLLQRAFRSSRLQSEAMKVRDVLFFQPGEFLFFVGTVVLGVWMVLRRRFVAGLACALVALAWIAYYRPVVAFINTLGVDAFAELDQFSFSEARFWLSTLAGLFEPQLKAKLIALYVLAAVVLFAGVHAAARPVPRLRAFGLPALSLLLMTGGIYLTLAQSAALFFDNSKSFLLTQKNFAGEPNVAVRGDGAPVDVLVYIGESTSTMNMGIYGYPRNTTPMLQAIERSDPGFIKFDHVLATHTHTAWSLLEAFSVGFDPAENFLPINYRRRMSVVELFDRGGIKPVLVSNQGSTGTWNAASSVIFKHAVRHFSTRSTLFGNDDYKLERPWDHELFEEVRRLDEGDLRGKRIVFFHSYAGHGPYPDNVPQEFRAPIDDFLTRSPGRAMVGPLVDHLPNIDTYDSALRYIDRGVAAAIEHTKRKSAPAILVYFSDHGDAVYAGRGHDSARFSHEMARVPFVVYFNEAARQAQPALYKKYRERAAGKASATLAQLPWTLLDLMGMQLDGAGAHAVHRMPVIGEKVVHPPIALRETVDGITYVNVNPSEIEPPPKANPKMVDVTDYATRYYAVHANRPAAPPAVCYHAANTFAKARRGAMVADCLEADFVVEPDGRINVYHPPKPSTGFTGERFVEAALGKSVWVDAKNLLTSATCGAMAQFLQDNRRSLASVLVEFPSQAYRHAAELRDCAARLRRVDVALSYYVPTDLATSCAAEIKSQSRTRSTCLALERDLKSADESGLFTDVSFDYKGVAAIESMPFLRRYAKNTWNVMPQDFAKIGPKGFRMVILNNDDPNSP